VSRRRPFEVEVGESVPVGGGAYVTRRRNGELLVRDRGLEASDVDPAVYDSDGVFVVPLGDWFVALGEESSRLLRWKVGDPQIAVHDLPRISFEGAYNPGGMFHARYFPVPGDRCLVATEESIALVHRDRGALWTYVHADVTVNVEAVTTHAVVLLSESDRSTLDLDTGRFVTSEPLDWP
jgi:hypothetical protein